MHNCVDLVLTNIPIKCQTNICDNRKTTMEEEGGGRGGLTCGKNSLAGNQEGVSGWS